MARGWGLIGTISRSINDARLPTQVRSTTSAILWTSLGVFALALLVRWPHLSQSLWLDEMTTLVDYVQHPWQRVLAARPGEYVPNNHVLHTAAAKVVYAPGSGGPNELLLRVPALLAGGLLPIALAWPMRREAPRLALSVALIAAMHPWLVAFSTEARGYSLMLLLGVVATNLLPDGRRRWPILYAVTLAAALYTVPIAILLLPAHGVAVFVRGAFCKGPSSPVSALARGQAIAVLLAILLYLPMARGMAQYYHRPFETTITYREFLDQLPRFALAGERLPRRADPIVHLPDSPAAGVYWALPVMTMIVGSVLARAQSAMLPLLISVATASVLGVLFPMASRAAIEVRFVPWASLWFILAFTAILAAPPQRWARPVALVGLILLLGWMGLRDVTMLPNQPVREAIQSADQLAPPGRRIVLTYLGAMEAAALYGGEASRHEIGFAHDMRRLVEAENRALVETAHRPWLVIGFEDLARRRNNGAEETRGMWSHLLRNYRLVARLPGRISAMAIYAPREQSKLAWGPGSGAADPSRR